MPTQNISPGSTAIPLCTESLSPAVNGLENLGLHTDPPTYLSPNLPFQASIVLEVSRDSSTLPIHPAPNLIIEQGPITLRAHLG